MATIRQNIYIDDTATIVRAESSDLLRYKPDELGQPIFISPPGVIVIETTQQRTTLLATGTRHGINCQVRLPGGASFISYIPPSGTLYLDMIPPRVELTFTRCKHDTSTEPFFIELSWVVPGKSRYPVEALAGARKSFAIQLPDMEA